MITPGDDPGTSGHKAVELNGIQHDLLFQGKSGGFRHAVDHVFEPPRVKPVQRHGRPVHFVIRETPESLKVINNGIFVQALQLAAQQIPVLAPHLAIASLKNGHIDLPASIKSAPFKGGYHFQPR